MIHLRAAILLLLALTSIASPSVSHAQRLEKYRSQYHFSPATGWIGDPDGLIHYRGCYHLFWWGHAISPDLVHWTELPYPILGDPGRYRVDSGSSVIDKKNVTGLGTNSFVNFHTLTGKHDQRVGASYSLDSAHNFTDFHLLKSNPILSPYPAPAEDFRDPQVFWDSQSKSWIMVVTLGDSHQLQFYRSSDLLHWGDRPISTFGPDGDSSAAWETPDLFALSVDGDPTHTQWVLTIGVSPNRMRYFIGNFDGTSFTNLYPGKILTVDWGPDFYAARTWREFDGPQTTTPLLGWIGNWQYSRNAPSQSTYGGEGVVSIPRNLALKSTADGIRLIQTPLLALQQLRETEARADNISVSGTHPITDFIPFYPRENSYEVDATFQVPSGTAPFGFYLLQDRAHTRQLTIRYDPAQSTLSVDRTTASDATLNRDFTAPLPPVHVETLNGQLRLRFFIDKSSVEIFTNDGKVVITALTYPGEDQRGIELFSIGAPTTLAHLSAWPLSSIWNGSPVFTIQSGSTYKLEAREDGAVITYSANAPLYPSPWLGQLTQQWKIDLVEPGFWQSFGHWVPPSYRLINQATGKAMELRDGSIIADMEWSAHESQKWQITGTGGGFFRLLPKTASREDGPQALGEQPSAPSHPALLQLSKFIAHHSQEWKLVAAPEPPRLTRNR